MAKQTGPRSEAGKQKSSGNSLTHGCSSKQHRILNGESEEQFDALRTRWFKEYGPDEAVDTEMVERVVQAEWRMRRCERQLAETEEFLDDTPMFQWSEEQHRLMGRARRYYSEALRFYNMARRDLDGMRLARQREIVAVYRAEEALKGMSLTAAEEAEREREKAAAELAGKPVEKAGEKEGSWISRQLRKP